MSSPNRPVEPAPFDLNPTAAPEPEQQRSGPSRHSSLLTTIALAALVVLALLVIFWLPGAVDPVTNTPPARTVTEEVAPALSAKPSAKQIAQPAVEDSDDASKASPWSDAQTARLRREAQDALQTLLELQFELEEQMVLQWASADYSAALAFAKTGDELYKAREFLAATEQYQQGTQALEALQASIPERLTSLLQQTVEAIEAGRIKEAQAAFDMATLIDPDESQLEPLAQRLERLPRLLDLLEQAKAAESENELQTAVGLLQEATEIDPDHRYAQQELSRVQAARLAQQFAEAMTAGYGALEDNRYDLARQGFNKALALQPDSYEAQNALTEVKAAESAYRLASLRELAKDLERQEQWQRAHDAYKQALAIAPAVVFAREGLSRTQPRADMERQLLLLIERPGRLSDPSVAQSAQQLLTKARAISPPGPRLQQQIGTLTRLLQTANTPVSVLLQSDLETEVIVYKVARLGRFQQRQMDLRPGTYTAVGSRDGFRDVRREFTVTHDNPPEPVTVICTEPI